MRSPITGIAALFVLFVVLIVGYSSVFTVSQTEQVLVVRLGEPVKVVTEPGLNFKAPFIDTVIPIDKRILDLENPSQEVIASDQKRLVADAYGKDPDFFACYRSMAAYENGLKSNDTRFLLRPDSDFFKFFSNSSGKPPAAPALPAAAVAVPKP